MRPTAGEMETAAEGVEVDIQDLGRKLQIGVVVDSLVIRISAIRVAIKAASYHQVIIELVTGARVEA